MEASISSTLEKLRTAPSLPHQMRLLLLICSINSRCRASHLVEAGSSPQPSNLYNLQHLSLILISKILVTQILWPSFVILWGRNGSIDSGVPCVECSLNITDLSTGAFLVPVYLNEKDLAGYFESGKLLHIYNSICVQFESLLSFQQCSLKWSLPSTA